MKDNFLTFYDGKVTPKPQSYEEMQRWPYTKPFIFQMDFTPKGYLRKGKYNLGNIGEKVDGRQMRRRLYRVIKKLNIPWKQAKSYYKF